MEVARWHHQRANQTRCRPAPPIVCAACGSMDTAKLSMSSPRSVARTEMCDQDARRRGGAYSNESGKSAPQTEEPVCGVRNVERVSCTDRGRQPRPSRVSVRSLRRGSRLESPCDIKRLIYDYTQEFLHTVRSLSTLRGCASLVRITRSRVTSGVRSQVTSRRSSLTRRGGHLKSWRPPPL
jgi:hypothetical protein